MNTLRNRLQKRLVPLAIAFVFWVAMRKPILPRLRSFIAPGLFFGGFAVCILSFCISSSYTIPLATAGCIAFVTGAWLLNPPIEK